MKTMKPTLLVLAAGIGSRYGGLKQVDGLGPGGHAILEYSVFDAIRAGFGKVVFVIRKDIEDIFKEKIGDKVKNHIQVEYAYQELTTGLEWLGAKTIERTKPWGTGHAVLAAKHLINEPFAVINADDFYGKAAYQSLSDFLQHDCKPNLYCMVGYQLKNTLSENGSVSRGVCSIGKNQLLKTVVEHTKIYKQGRAIFSEHQDSILKLPGKTLVSMNFWGFHPNIMQVSETMFKDFVEKNMSNLKSEFFIPLVVNQQINQKKIGLKVLSTDAEWFGVTYTADKEIVQKALKQAVKAGVYPVNLWAKN
jgi:NDP-sugar pyrophosphorylase family protein